MQTSACSWVACLLLAGLLPAQAAERRLEPLPADRQKGFESIDPETCREWLTYLASDELEGRETGRPGFEKAAQFIAKKFAEFGLEPLGENGSYFQPVPWTATEIDVAKSTCTVLKEGAPALELAFGKDIGGRITSSSQGELDLVVVRGPFDRDRQLPDLTGKAVLVWPEQAPPQDRPGQPGRTGRQRGTPAVSALAQKGASCVLTLDDLTAATLVGSNAFAGGGAVGAGRQGRFRMPNSYSVRQALGAQLLELAGRDETALAQAEGGVLALTGLKLRLAVACEPKPVFAANVVGLLRGRDEKLASEVVGVGAHLDHIGTRDGGEGDRISNGADDDGSGTTGVLAVVKAFAQNGHRPRRSILFMTFCGEEKGLIGSRWYANHPLLPNDRMVAEIQMDMIGRNEERGPRGGDPGEKAEDNLNSLHLVGTKKLSQELHDICLAMNAAHVGFDFEWDEENVFDRSDHVSFAEKEIPIAFLFTGFHPQYHQVGDEVERIDFAKLARVAKLAYAIAFEVADREAPPKKDRTFKEAMVEHRKQMQEEAAQRRRR